MGFNPERLEKVREESGVPSGGFKPENLELARRGEPIPDSLPAIANPSFMERVKGGFTGEREPEAFLSPETLGKEGPVIGSSLLGLLSGGPAGAVLGAASGRSAQLAARAATKGDVTPGQAVGEPLLEAGLAAVTGGVGKVPGAKQALGKGAANLLESGLASPAIDVGFRTVRPLLTTVSGVSQDFLQTAFMKPAQTMAKRIEGAADIAIDQARDTFKSVIGTASKKYDDVMQGLLDGSKYAEGWRYPLVDEIGDAVAKTKKKFGFGSTKRFGVEESQAKTFRGMMDRLRQLESATMEDVILFQRDLNQQYSQNLGNPLGAAFKEVRNALRASLAKSVPEIRMMNEAYAKLKPIEKFAEKTADKELLGNFLRAIAGTPSRLSAKKFKLMAEAFPETQRAMDDVLEAMAGQAVKEPLGQLPRTGFTGAFLGAGAAEGGLNPLLLGAGLFTSPRFVGRTAALAGKASEALKTKAGKFGASRAVSLEEAFRRQRENSDR